MSYTPEIIISKAYQRLGQIPYCKILQYLPDFAFYNVYSLNINLIAHLGTGHNIRTHPIEFPFTKRMAHIFHNLTIRETLVYNTYLYCLIKSLGGTKELVDIFCCNMGIDIMAFDRERYCTIDRVKRLTLILQKLIEWDFHYLPEDIALRAIGFISHILQDLPNFKIKGRTFASFNRLVDAYYLNFELERLGGLELTWEGALFKNWEGRIRDEKYKIVQLHSLKELILESSVLQHCVREYGEKCVEGNCSIYSLRMVKEDILISLVTIEVNAYGEIVQAKTKYNQQPSNTHFWLIKTWARREGITLIQ